VEGASEAVEPMVKLTHAVGGLAAGTEIRLPAAVSNLTLTNGKAQALAGKRVPVFISGANDHAHLLNVDLTHFDQERRFHSPTEKQFKALLCDLLARAGVKPRYPVTLKSGKASQVEVIRYQASGVEYLCLLNSSDDADVATIPLGAKRQVYDVRAASSRGRLDTLTVPLDPKCARLYCLTDAPLPPPTISAPKSVDRATATQQPTLVQFAVGRSASSPVRQLVRITVTDATGRLRPEYQETVWVDQSAVHSSFPLALNDPPGTWTITATEVVSGQNAAERVEVR